MRSLKNTAEMTQMQAKANKVARIKVIISNHTYRMTNALNEHSSKTDINNPNKDSP